MFFASEAIKIVLNLLSGLAKLMHRGRIIFIFLKKKKKLFTKPSILFALPAAYLQC